MRVYIVWVKGKKVTLKKPPGRMFRDCLVGRLYPRDTRENDSLARLFSFQPCAPHVALSRLSFSRNPLILHLSLSLHQLNTKLNTIKSHKVQGYKLKQLQHFLSRNKANINHSCKSQLYIPERKIVNEFDDCKLYMVLQNMLSLGMYGMEGWLFNTMPNWNVISTRHHSLHR